ncbi:MAG: tetratricopeptide repeat protein [Pseudomonadota bacterium]
MELYDSEQEQVDAIKKWWKENGTTTIVGIVLGLGAVVGWTGWQEYQQRQAESASTLFEDQRVATRENDYEKSATLAAQLAEEHGSSTYATLGALLMAKLAYDSGQLDDARRQYQWVIEKSDNPGMVSTARLRLAKLNLSAGDADGALTLLNNADPGTFAASADEIKGDAYLVKGDAEQARAAYERALNEGEPNATVRQRLQMKLDDLGHENFSSKEG